MMGLRAVFLILWISMDTLAALNVSGETRWETITLRRPWRRMAFQGLALFCSAANAPDQPNRENNIIDASMCGLPPWLWLGLGLARLRE
jgi:hypothetical protein